MSAADPLAAGDSRPAVTLESLAATVEILQAKIDSLTLRLHAINPLTNLVLEQPLRSVLTACSILGFGAIFLFFFSGIFIGPRFFQFISVDFGVVYASLGASLVILVLLLLFDAPGWHTRSIFKGTGNFWQLAGAALCGLGFVVGAFAAVRSYPSYPLAVAIAAFPLLAMMLKGCLLGAVCACKGGAATTTTSAADGSSEPSAEPSEQDKLRLVERRIGAYSLITKSFILLAVCSSVAWLAWLAAYDAWAFGSRTRLLLGGEAGCSSNATAVATQAVVDTGSAASPEPLTCDQTFLLWCSPLILSCISIVNAVVFGLLAIQSRAEHRALLADVASPDLAMKTMGFLAVGCVFLLWCAASIAGAGMRVAHDVMAVVGAAGVALALVVALNSKVTKDGKERTRQRASKYLEGEWVQAMLVFMGACPMALYLLLSWVRQLVRRCGSDRCICKPADMDEGKPLSVGRHARNVYRAVKAAEYKTQVLLKVQMLCMATWAMLFGSTLTFICLAALILWLKTLPLALVLVFFFVIGIVMFLIPVVRLTAPLSNHSITSTALWDPSRPILPATPSTCSPCSLRWLTQIVDRSPLPSAGPGPRSLPLRRHLHRPNLLGCHRRRDGLLRLHRHRRKPLLGNESGRPCLAAKDLWRAFGRRRLGACDRRRQLTPHPGRQV